jgi:hypothetical protein
MYQARLRFSKDANESNNYLRVTKPDSERFNNYLGE